MKEILLCSIGSKVSSALLSYIFLILTPLDLVWLASYGKMGLNTSMGK